MKKSTVKLKSKLWIEINGIKCFGPGPCTLLELIEETGSISQAAKKMNMSYKKAWEIVSRLNEVTGHQFVLSNTGGEHGGGSYISDKAKEMIRNYQHLQERLQGFLEGEEGLINI